MNGNPAVRIAASKRRILIGLRGYVMFCFAGWVLQLLRVPGVPLQLPVLMVAVVAFWSWDQRTAVWIESTDGGLAIRRRELWKLRAGGRVIQTYPVGTTVSYDATSRWWRVDRGLHIAGDRYAVLPESRKEAQRLAPTDSSVVQAGNK